MTELQEFVAWCTVCLVAVLLSSAVTAVVLWLVTYFGMPAGASLLVVGACMLASAGIVTLVAKTAGRLISKAKGE